MKHLLTLSLLLGASMTASASANSECPKTTKEAFNSLPKQVATNRRMAQMFPAKGLDTNASGDVSTIKDK